MNDWEKLAQGVTPRLPASEWTKAVPALEALEQVLISHRDAIPHSVVPWTGVPETGTDAAE